MAGTARYLTVMNEAGKGVREANNIAGALMPPFWPG